MKTGILFPPESSTSWLLQDSILLQILSDYDFIIIDKEDYKRIQRFAHSSKISFVNSFLLNLLIKNRFIKVLDYSYYYSKTDCEKIIEQSNTLTDKLFNFDNDLIYELALDAYKSYLNYARNDYRKNSINLIDEDEIKSFEKTKEDAEEQLKLIESKSIGINKIVPYWNRLYTKILSSYFIAKRAEYYLKCRVKVFDSPEYYQVPNSLEIIKNPLAKSMKDSSDLDKLLIPSAIQPSIYKRILENNQEIENDNNLIPLLISYIISIDKIQGSLIDYLNSNNEKELEKEVLELQLKYFKGQNRALKSKGIIFNILSSFGIPMFMVSLTGSIKETLNSIQEVAIDSKYSQASKLILLAILLNEPGVMLDKKAYKKDIKYWTFRLKTLLKGVYLKDKKWKSTQSSMKDWTNQTLYRPWYEDPFSKRFKF